MTQRTVLLIAYHFPPLRGSSGMQRTLRFAQHLPKFGWRPIVLTVTPTAYDSTVNGRGNEVPEGLEVHRAFGLDSARHLSFFGRYPGFLSIPDRWTTWRFWALPAALRIIRRQHIDAIWSTFPIATAHEVGRAVARRSGLPWIAEFRDPMWQGDYPPEPRINRAWKALEMEVFGHAQRIVVTTQGAKSTYQQRFPSSRVELIENGYDEEVFLRAERTMRSEAASEHNRSGPITLLHSGIVYRSERDPTQLFAAIANMKSKGLISANTLQLVLRASGDEIGYQRDLESLRIQDIVRLKPSIDYLAALKEMLRVEGLVILQASNCNCQVPAKLYEYLRAGRPIIALTDPAGDTARTLDSAGVGVIGRLDSAGDIERALLRVIEQIRTGKWPVIERGAIARYSREAQAEQLARLLDEI